QAFALSHGAMICPFTIGAPRRKAVWGPKRILAAAVLMGVALAPNATAAGLHSHSAAKSASGRPNSRAAAYKLDTELETRATTNTSSTLYPYGNQRVAKFVDFVNGRTQPYDDNGHGTHVAGIIAGNGYDSGGRKAGAAPEASLIALKVLDANGNGTVSNIIAALDWVLANHTKYNIRVVNMSVGSSIHESAWTDPLTLAAKKVVDAGVVVVAAAGNFGRNAAGQIQYGGISAPGNAPWVLTVGGSSTQGTTNRADVV